MEKLVVSSSPHFHGGNTTQKTMCMVLVALAPAMVASVVFFGGKAALLLAVCVISCVAFEAVSRKVMKRKQTISDLSAVVTGVLLALNLPPSLHPLMAVFGCLVAIVVAKQMFGGIGQNFVNPALTARIILLNSFPAQMTTWTEPNFASSGVDAVTSATPLAQYAAGLEGAPDYLSLFLGNTMGCIGETCALALLVGGVFLMVTRVISPVIPVAYIGSVAIFSLLFGRDPLFDILSGGLLIGALFMATDYTTSPLYFKGRIVYAIGCGVLTMVIRAFGSLSEGVSYAIVIMNIIVPLIERYIKPVAFGKERAKREA